MIDLFNHLLEENNQLFMENVALRKVILQLIEENQMLISFLDELNCE